MSIWVSQSVDIAIPCREGTVAIAVTDRSAPRTALREPDMQTVCAEVARLGGEQPGPARE